mmetsp:Transcript_37673/g.95385  ORF Transcript_37673/g.95385 Transcript_37673/m.95385 type:complete len:213 (-) Transcript_37673:64-702(-)
MVSMANIGVAREILGPLATAYGTSAANSADLALCVRRDGMIQGEDRPLTAGEPLHRRLRDGRLISPLHPVTANCFEHTRRRQAYGTVAPGGLNICHQPARNPEDHEDEVRRRWFKAYNGDCERRAHKEAVINPARPRSLGASGRIGHAETSENGWQWQSWRGWTTTSRHNHEQSMREQWMKEAQERWQAKQGGTSWKLDAADTLPAAPLTAR